MKNIKYIIIIFLMFIGISNIYAADNSIKVYDYAQVLTATEEKNLKNSIDLFIANYNMDMALVTVKYHDKSNTMNYADDFYDYNNFGIGTNKDGVIFVIDFTFGYTDIWMSTSGKAIDIYTDDRIDSILDSVAYEKDNGYYEMFNTFINKSDYYAKQGVSTNTINDSNINWLNIIIFSFIVPTIIIVIFVLRNKMVRHSTNANQYLVKNSVVINKRDDRFVTTHTTSVRINDSSSSGGRSSTHTSSSGRSHGGGGRRL